VDVARFSNDLGLQANLLENWAIVQNRMGNHERGAKLGKEALILYQKAGHITGEIGVCDFLGTVERGLGHLDAAEAWYARGRELAEKTKNQYALAVIAQNVGVLQQRRASQANHPEERDVHMRQALSSTQESLAIRLKMNDQVKAALSYYQLGILHQMLGELDRAEENLQQSLRIRESLNLRDVLKDYGALAGLARARGDAKAAAEWQAKRDAKVAELELRHHTGGDDPEEKNKTP
jgi:tetratricopeptide (TPR) repeat protein